jgi:hypothetical protein
MVPDIFYHSLHVCVFRCNNGFEMTCDKCKEGEQKHHRRQETRRYNDIPGGLMLIPNRLCVKLQTVGLFINDF